MSDDYWIISIVIRCWYCTVHCLQLRLHRNVVKCKRAGFWWIFLIFLRDPKLIVYVSQKTVFSLDRRRGFCAFGAALRRIAATRCQVIQRCYRFACAAPKSIQLIPMVRYPTGLPACTISAEFGDPVGAATVWCRRDGNFLHMDGGTQEWYLPINVRQMSTLFCIADIVTLMIFDFNWKIKNTIDFFIVSINDR